MISDLSKQSKVALEKKSDSDIGLPKFKQISGDYISGLIEGDGCLTYHVRVNKRSVSFEASLRITVEKGGFLILEVIASYFGDKTKFHLKSSRSKGGACVYWSSNKEVLKRNDYWYMLKPTL
jgi:LAGLIDADG endonuclease